MKKPTAGCEIQAIGINYTINKQKKESPFRFLNRVRGNLIRNQVQEVQDGAGVVDDESCLRKVLKDVNCRGKPWEILAIVGPSGAGKSSLLEILAAGNRVGDERIRGISGGERRRVSIGVEVIHDP